MTRTRPQMRHRAYVEPVSSLCDARAESSRDSRVAAVFLRCVERCLIPRNIENSFWAATSPSKCET